MSFLTLINYLLYKKKILIPTEKLLISLSGGQDSFCLFFLFWQLKLQWNFDLKPLWCHHFWQIDSFYVMKHILKAVFAFQMESYLPISFELNLSEERARIWRYKAFQRVSFFDQTSNVLTGHTLSDKIETSFFHIIRGSGIRGIQTLKIKRSLNQNLNKILFATIKEYLLQKKIYRKHLPVNKKIKIKNKKIFLNFINQNTQTQIIRPLLFLHRFDCKKLITFWKLPIYPDKTNKNYQYSRNRIRNQLVPTIRFFFNPKFDIIFNRFLLILQNEDSYFTRLNSKFLHCIPEQQLKQNSLSKNKKQLAISLFNVLPQILQERIIQFFFQLNNKKDLSYISIKLLVKEIKKNLKKNKLNNTLTCSKYIFIPKIGLILVTVENLYFFN